MISGAVSRSLRVSPNDPHRIARSIEAEYAEYEKDDRDDADARARFVEDMRQEQKYTVAEEEAIERVLSLLRMADSEATRRQPFKLPSPLFLRPHILFSGDGSEDIFATMTFVVRGATPDDVVAEAYNFASAKSAKADALFKVEKRLIESVNPHHAVVYSKVSSFPRPFLPRDFVNR